MPRGPNGERRPADVVGCAVRVAEVATGQVEEVLLKAPGRRKSGKAGAKVHEKGVGSFGVHGRVSATVQNGRLVLVSKDKMKF